MMDFIYITPKNVRVKSEQINTDHVVIYKPDLQIQTVVETRFDQLDQSTRG